jgi:SAM-dependent methyltransferase
MICRASRGAFSGEDHNMTEASSREEVLRGLFDTSGHGLEIGAGFSPLLPKQAGYSVEIVDHASAQELRAKYASEPAIDPARIEEVDHIWDGRPLSEVIGAKSCYDFVVASHLIEHTPDMLGFLKECETLLKPKGIVVLAVPDKRRCFDVLRPLSTTGAVLQAHLEKRKRHIPAIAFDEVAYSVKLNGSPAWSEAAKGTLSQVHSLDFAQAIFDRSASSHEYFDFHAWVFTPHSFRLLIRELNELGALALQEVHFRPMSNHEFFITLSRSGSGCSLDRAALIRCIVEELREFPG